MPRLRLYHLLSFSSVGSLKRFLQMYLLGAPHYPIPIRNVVAYSLLCKWLAYAPSAIQMKNELFRLQELVMF